MDGQRRGEESHQLEPQVERQIVSGKAEEHERPLRQEQESVISASVFLVGHIFLGEQARHQPHKGSQERKELSKTVQGEHKAEVRR